MNFRKIFYISSFISDQAFNNLAEHSIDVILPSLVNEFWILCSPHLFQQLPSPRRDLTWAIISRPPLLYRIRDFRDNTRQKQPFLRQRLLRAGVSLDHGPHGILTSSRLKHFITPPLGIGYLCTRMEYSRLDAVLD